MPNRTAEANKAILAAWENEQKRVSEGTGTRDWTPEQQQDILDRGKAYDENGKAFHGQHMRSAEKHPEYQGDPNNIQFLTKDEHLAAHDGDWRNPTNWYYDPVTKTKLDFGDGPIIPCTVIDLSQPIRVPDIVAVEKTEDDIPKESAVKEQSVPRAPPAQERPHVQSTPRSVRPQTPPPPAPTGFWAGVRKGARIVWNGTKKVGRIAWEHKGEIGAVLLPIVADAVVNKITRSQESGSGSSSSFNAIEHSHNPSTLDPSNNASNPSPVVNRNYPETHASPQPHMVGKTGDGQHYHTKQGVIWKEKAPYPRGGKHSDE